MGIAEPRVTLRAHEVGEVADVVTQHLHATAPTSNGSGQGREATAPQRHMHTWSAVFFRDHTRTTTYLVYVYSVTGCKFTLRKHTQGYGEAHPGPPNVSAGGEEEL